MIGPYNRGFRMLKKLRDRVSKYRAYRFFMYFIVAVTFVPIRIALALCLDLLAAVLQGFVDTGRFTRDEYRSVWMIFRADWRNWRQEAGKHG